MSDDPRVDAFFEAGKAWKPELNALRAIMRKTPVVETWKWRSPVYCWEDKNLAILWRMKERAGIGFFKGVLIEDEKGLLQAPGDNSRSSRVMNFTDTDQIAQHSADIVRFVAAAIEIEKNGLKVEFPKDDLPYPEELSEIFASDPDLDRAFHDLTPGRRRGWILHFSGAKQSETRRNRIQKAASRILAGKGMNDR